MTPPKVSIVLLNWNTWEDTIECLESLRRIDYTFYEIVLIDNNSSDKSVEKITEYLEGDVDVSPKYVSDRDPCAQKEYFSVETTGDDGLFEKTSENSNINNFSRGTLFLKNDENLGFPGGSNLGMRVGINRGADYVLLLNNDVVVKPDFLTELVDTAEEFDDVGVVGSKILDYTTPELIQSVGGDIHWYTGRFKVYGQGELDEGQFDQIEERDYVWGTSALFPTQVVEDVGFMNTSFFYGVEEYDYHTRIRNAGYNVIYAPSSEVWHKGGKSSEKLSEYEDTLQFIKDSQGPYKAKYFYRFYKKHLPPGLFLIPFSIRTLLYVLHHLRGNKEVITPAG